jgi:hypothetical protein
MSRRAAASRQPVLDRLREEFVQGYPVSSDE